LDGRQYDLAITNGAASWIAASAPLVSSVLEPSLLGGRWNLVLAGSGRGRFSDRRMRCRRIDECLAMTQPVWMGVGLVFDPVNGSTVYAVYSSFKVNASDAHIYK